MQPILNLNIKKNVCINCFIGGQQNGNINNDADLQANGSDQISDLYQDPWDKAKYPNPQNNNILPPTTDNGNFLMPYLVYNLIVAFINIHKV